jgi:hypothetical protein
MAIEGPIADAAQVAAGDLDIAVIGQLPVSQLPLGDALELGAMHIIGFDAALRRYRRIDKAAERLSWNAHHSLVFSDADPELDRLPVGIPASIFGKGEEHRCRWDY